ncbi:MAG: hypothetical protein ABGX04_08715 [Myxococcales bacterium]|nr:hypothetical protein [Myxococcales bacterium]
MAAVSSVLSTTKACAIFCSLALFSLSLAAKAARKLGANTAGVGVCFLSRELWKQELEAVGLEVRDTGWMPMQLPLYQRVPLAIGTIGAAHMWCGKS